MFYDFNVRLSTCDNQDTSLNPIIQRLVKYGYKGLAITTEVDESIFEKVEVIKKKKAPNSKLSNPNNAIPPPPDLSKLKTKFPKVKFYNRINIVISESSNLTKFLKCINLKKYDLISFQPESQNALKMLIGTAEIDIISYNPEKKFLLSFNRKIYNQFVKQNVYFELTYSSAILDSTSRRNLLSLSHTYRAFGKSKNIVVSSGAMAAHHIRAPYDVCNFNLLFGLSEEQSKSSISRTCEKLLVTARKRRLNKAVIEMVKIQNTNEETLMAADLPEGRDDL